MHPCLLQLKEKNEDFKENCAARSDKTQERGVERMLALIMPWKTVDSNTVSART